MVINHLKYSWNIFEIFCAIFNTDFRRPDFTENIPARTISIKQKVHIEKQSHK